MRNIVATLTLCLAISVSSFAYFNSAMMRRVVYKWVLNVVSKNGDLPALSGHTSVWTGTQHIVYGGVTSTGAVSSTYMSSIGDWLLQAYPSQVSLFSSSRSFITYEGGGYLFMWGGCESSNPVVNGYYYTSNGAATMMSLTNMPSTFVNATDAISVWTGSKYIIWGGSSCSSLSGNTGAIFDPVANSWSTITTVNAPAARVQHSAYWTGTELLIWGGSSGGSYVNTGARYNPTTNIWTTMSTTNAPVGRLYNATHFVNGKLVIWGGLDSSFGQLNSGAIYDVATDTWTTISATNAFTNFSKLTAGYASEQMSDKIMFTSAGTSFRIFDPSTNSWTNPSSTNIPTTSRSISFLLKWVGTKLVLWGGSNGSAGLQSGSIYDPVADTWTTISTTNAAASTYNFAYTVVNSKLYMWGGFGTGGTANVNTGAYLDPSTNTWTAMSAAPANMVAGANTWAYNLNDKILFKNTTNSSIASYYDYSTDTWASTFGGQFGLSLTSYHAAGWTGTQMFAFGGVSGTTVFNSSSLYNPSTNTWTAGSTTNAPTPRYNTAMVWSGTQFWVWGGTADGTSGINTGGGYNPTTATWTTMSTTNAPSARFKHTSVWTGSKVIIWGGVHAGSAIGNGAMYDPATDTWTSISSTNAPSARYNHQAVWTGTQMFVWGGTNGTSRTNTGAMYDPNTDIWTTVTSTSAPPARELFTATWTGKYVVLFGGKDSATYYADSYFFNPNVNSWTKLLDSGAAGRSEHTSVWTGTYVWIVAGQGSSAKQKDTYYLPIR